MTSLPTSADISALDIVQAIDRVRADYAFQRICHMVADTLLVKDPSQELLERIASHLTLP